MPTEKKTECIERKGKSLSVCKKEKKMASSRIISNSPDEFAADEVLEKYVFVPRKGGHGFSRLSGTFMF